MPEKPQGINEILKKGSAEIFKLLEDKEIMQLVVKYNKDYIPWDELRYKKIPKDIKPEHIWVLMKMFRGSQYRTLKFNKWSFKYVLLDEFQKKLHLLDKGTAGRLGSNLEAINVSGREKYIISSLMEEAIASSQLEGAATTRKVAKELLRYQKKPKSYSEQMIVNGYKTIQKIVRMRERVITPEIILELHKNITEDTLKDKKHEGRFRDNNKIVVGDPLILEKIYHQPPDYKELPKLIDEFCSFANSDTKDFVHPIIKGIMLHFLMGYIHPFEDGNGRTARTLFYWYVLTRGYWLFEFMAISRIILRSKVRYGLSYLYTETDENDLTYFLDYNLDAIEEAFYDMESYISRKQEDQAEALKLIGSVKGINLRQAEILKRFIKDPEKSFVVREIMGVYGIAYDTARTDLLYLAKLGYLEKMKVQNKFVFNLSKDKVVPK